jgi:hypothetical protein
VNASSLSDPSFRKPVAIKVGSQPMDMAFRADRASGSSTVRGLTQT